MIARVTIRRVRFKSGGEVRLIAPIKDEGRARAERGVRAVLDGHEQFGGIAGFAFVAWAADGATTGDLWAGSDSSIPAILIPDLVRNQLLAMKIEEYTIDTINESNGYSPDGTG